jgi:hypothetical protein
MRAKNWRTRESRLCPIGRTPYKRHSRTGVAANAVGRSVAFRVEARLAAGRRLSVISTVARPGDRREGEDLVVMKQSDIIGNIAS